MHILITGGTGLIGRELTRRLLIIGHQITVVTRSVTSARRHLPAQVSLWEGLDHHPNLDGINAVINLAGEPIADKRWTPARKTRLCESRWHITEQLVQRIQATAQPPEVLISGSAMGYYGDQGEVVVNEDDPPHNEFTHQLCQRWEHIACQARSDRTRVCLLRTGVVLAPGGGMMARLLPLFRLGLGGPLGSGRQYIPWIHLDDMVNGIIWLLDNNLQGPFNMVAPWPVHNSQFAHTLGRVVHRPALLRTPATVIRMIMGEASILVLGGQRGLPARLEQAGFAFRWHDLEDALRDVAG